MSNGMSFPQAMQVLRGAQQELEKVAQLLGAANAALINAQTAGAQVLGAGFSTSDMQEYGGLVRKALEDVDRTRASALVAHRVLRQVIGG